MGTNFYMFTKKKDVIKKYAPWDFEIVDEPEFGYKFHVAKTSAGWLPLFQGHSDGAQSVRDYQSAYVRGCKIFDEYGTEYNWEDFDERVIKWNGGVRGAKKKYKIEKYGDMNMPEYAPVSHIRGSDQSYYINDYHYDYFVDKDGYEFLPGDFS